MTEPTEDHLFLLEEFTSYSGLTLNWKIDCDALTDDDLRCLAFVIYEHFLPIGKIIGIPRGGTRLAEVLIPYQCKSGITLIVDDVLTTGRSMEQTRSQYPDAKGVVIFARGKCPDWVWPVFSLSQ